MGAGRNFFMAAVFNPGKVEARHMKNTQANIKTEAKSMRKQLLTALTGVTLCLAFASNPNPILAEDDGADLQPGVSLRQRIDTNGDGTIDVDEKAAFRKHYLKRFDRNNDGKLDRNERRHARRRFDSAEDRRDRREDRWDRRENVRDHREDRRDRREDVRDRREDVWDRREDVRDRREDIRDRKDDQIKANRLGNLEERLANTDDPKEKARLERQITHLKKNIHRDKAEDRWDRREDRRDHREDRWDRREDVRDHREDRRDRWEDVRDRREDHRDRREDFRDRREDRRDRKEDIREFHKDRRQHRRHATRSGGAGS